MKTYLVGGAVRDELLGLPITERDWVVVGATPEQMLALGYQPVGKDFPVFLHPVTHEEYALARTERKTGTGYKGFVFHADPSVSLIDDLKRRDLTINAIAKDDDGTLIDPYHGCDDLNHKTLRHVSVAFAEDPVRLLRLARFAAKLPDFCIDPATQEFITTMVTNGEVDALISERVWQELERALSEPEPNRFFAVLDSCGALALLFPALQNKIPNINIKNFSREQRFALLLHELTLDEIKTLCSRYKVPTEFSDLALLTKQLSSDYKSLNTKDAHALLAFLKRGDALRRPERFANMIAVLAHMYHANHLPLLQNITQAIKQIDTTALQAKGLKNSEFAQALEELQLQVIKKFS